MLRLPMRTSWNERVSLSERMQPRPPFSYRPKRLTKLYKPNLFINRSLHFYLLGSVCRNASMKLRQMHEERSKPERLIRLFILQRLAASTEHAVTSFAQFTFLFSRLSRSKSVEKGIIIADKLLRQKLVEK